MDDRQRYIACVLGEPVDRPPFWLFWGTWTTTWQRWEREGKPPEAFDHRSIFNPDQPPLSVQVDVIHLWEDMCYRAGPLISPKMWQEFLGPNYRRIKAFADQHNIPVISVDTDGNPDRITSPMISAGVNLLIPLEMSVGKIIVTSPKH
jgi:hypothetical protein